VKARRRAKVNAATRRCSETAKRFAKRSGSSASQ
jgi:hypothetical protein